MSEELDKEWRAAREKLRRMTPQERHEDLIRTLRANRKTWEDFLEDMASEPTVDLLYLQ